MSFQPFPEEAWEMILGELEDSRDILNVLKSLPELEVAGVLKTKRHIWLFDQVVPQLCQWLIQKELLTCRQVCRRWSLAVDNFVENHPQKRAFSHEIQITGQNWLSEASQAYSRLDSNYFYGGSHFTDCESLSHFHQIMGDHPNRNPFVGRALFISEERLGEGDTLDGLWVGIPQALRKFGEHVWFLTFNSDLVQAPTQTLQRFVDALSSLPNLKGLRITMEPDWNEQSEVDVGEFLEAIKDTFPHLPQLETLELEENENMPQSLVHILLSKYSLGIRRLRIRQSYWSDNYEAHLSFPELTEFTLTSVNMQNWLNKIMTGLSAPKLTNLKLLLFRSKRQMSESSIQNDVIANLQRFPCLTSLKLALRLKYVPPFASPNQGNEKFLTNFFLPSLKSLCLSWYTDEISFKFLQSFPCLEYFRISGRPHGDLLNMSKMNSGDLWERILPKLKEATVYQMESMGGDRRDLYSRAKYEWVKRHGNV